MIAVVHLPHLALSCAPPLAKEQVKHRLVIVDEENPGVVFLPRGHHRIVDADPALWQRRILPGARLAEAQARALSSSIVVVTRSRLRRALDGVAELLLRCSPVVEPLPPSSIALDLRGMTRPTAVILQEIEAILVDAGHDGVVVVASPGRRLSTALAIDAARAPNRYKHRKRFVVDEANAARARERVGIGALGLDDDTLTLLLDLGVRTAGELRALVPGGAAARLVNEARGVLRLFDPSIEEPLTPLRPPEHIVEVVDLEEEVGFLEPLRFVLAPLCERAVRRVLARQQKVAAVDVEFVCGRDIVLDEVAGDRRRGFSISLEFPEPLFESKALLNAIGTRLEQTGIPGPVLRAELRVLRAGVGRQRQTDAFRADDAAPAALSALLAELHTELGAGAAGVQSVVSSLLPEEMTALSWPPLPKKKKKHADVVGVDVEAIVEGGAFLAAWPWPVRLLRVPVVIGDLADEDVVERLPFARLEGEDSRGQPFCRDYRILCLRDGRWLLTFVDPDVDEPTLCGWFD